MDKAEMHVIFVEGTTPPPHASWYGKERENL